MIGRVVPARSARPAWLTALSLAVILLIWWNARGPEVQPAEPATAPLAAQTDSVAAPVERTDTRTPQGYDLARDESRGGRTLSRHVAKSDDELRARLEREPGISIANWVTRGERRPNLAIDYRGTRSEIIGRTLARGRDSAEPSTDAVVVLRADGREYYVLTSYPERRR